MKCNKGELNSQGLTGHKGCLGSQSELMENSMELYYQEPGYQPKIYKLNSQWCQTKYNNFCA